MRIKRQRRMFHGSTRVSKSFFRSRLRRFRTTTTSEADLWF